MANKVTITDTKNQVTITPQSSNNIDASTTNTPVTVTQGTTSVVQVNNPGPQGPIGATGPVGAFNAGDDVTIDAAALCIKSSNSAILRPGSESYQSCLALFNCICVLV